MVVTAQVDPGEVESLFVRLPKSATKEQSVRWFYFNLSLAFQL